MRELEPIGPFKTSTEYFLAGLDNAWSVSEPSTPGRSTRGAALVKGVRDIMEMIIESAAFTPTPTQPDELPLKGKFVLRHDDLDLQNIFVDNDSNVTGIID
jgi:hypothetical protein